MTRLEWDAVGDRRFETGVDRGVLYLMDGTAVPWNGLTQVNESLERDVKSYFIDGIKFLDHQVPGSFSAKVQAFTYPEELDDLLGRSVFAPGVYLHDQRAKMFHLSYRTLIGNDVEGTELGYRLHIMYNLLATPSSVAMGTMGKDVSPVNFEWTLSGTPPVMFGARPTSHISFDSRLVDPTLLAAIEDLLYGTPTAAPDLPDMVTLLGMAEGT